MNDARYTIMPKVNSPHSLSSRAAVAALLLLLAVTATSHDALLGPPPDPPAPQLERFDPGKLLPEGERSQRLDELRPGLTREQVRHLLGAPTRIARQILYHRYFEQWLYDAPFHVRVEFECRRGQEAQILSVRETRPGRP
jgi:hypothetical protein